MFKKLIVLVMLTGCVSADYQPSAWAMAYVECNKKTSIEWGRKHSRGSSTELGQEVEAYCRGQSKINVPLENQLLWALSNAARIDNIRR